MSAPAFTPGQWYAKSGVDQTVSMDTTVALLGLSSDGGQWFVFSPAEDGDQEATANLIAAAPELYEALTLALEPQGEHAAGCKEYAPGFDDSHCCWVHMARSALAKARGEA